MTATRANGKTIALIATTALAITLALSNAMAKDDAVQCGNLIFAGNNTSRCFSDEFLAAIQRQTTIATAKRFKSVKRHRKNFSKYLS